MSKVFCVNCEKIQQYTPHCIKCQSKNVFHVGPDARFPKHPKKDDYFHIFNILLNIMTQSSDIHKGTSIHKWITGHKYRNHVRVPGGYRGTSHRVDVTYKERVESLLAVVKKRDSDMREKIKYSVVHPSYHNIISNDESKAIQSITKRASQGYTIPALLIILDGDPYDKKSEINPFRPKKVNSNILTIFKDKSAALAISSTLAQNFLDSDISEDHPELAEHAKVYARKRRDLLSEFPEHFV